MCSSSGNCCRDHHVCITWITALLAFGGVVAMIAGGVNYGTAEDSTSLAEVDKFLNYYPTLKMTMSGTTMSNGAVPLPATNGTITYDRVTKEKVRTQDSFTQLAFRGSVVRPTTTDVAVVLSTSNTFQNAAPETSMITSATIPMVNDAGENLRELCVVITRPDTANEAWELADDYESCLYPFKADSQVYEAGYSGPVGVKVISSRDPQMAVEFYGKGTGVVEDRDVKLVAGWALPALIAGIALTVIFLPLTAVIVLCCWDKPQDEMCRTCGQIFCPCCHDHPKVGAFEPKGNGAYTSEKAPKAGEV